MVAVSGAEGLCGQVRHHGGAWGRSPTSPEGVRRVGRTLADAALNVMRHYQMIPGEARSATILPFGA